MTQHPERAPLVARSREAGFLHSYGEAWSSGDGNKLAAFFATDGTYVEGAMGATYQGVEAVAGFFRYMLAFSSDSFIEFTSLIQEGDSFAAEWVWRGTMDGPLELGRDIHPPNGRSYRVPGVAICRNGPDGLIARHVDYYDVRTLVVQLGLDSSRRTP